MIDRQLLTDRTHIFSLTSYDTFEWTARDIDTGEFDGDEIIARGSRSEIYAITFRYFSAVQLNFRWAIDRHRQGAGTRVHRIDQEFARMTRFALVQASARGKHSAGIRVRMADNNSKG